MSKTIKKGIKIIGIACSSFNREKDAEVKIIGTIYRGSELIEGILSTVVTVDGEDATIKIAEMITNSDHFKQLKIIMTRGVTIAGFNFIDLKKLFELTKLPIISIVDRKPNMEKITAALLNLENGNYRLQIIEQNGYPIPLTSNPQEESIFVQYVGLKQEEMESIITNSTLLGKIPEPLRAATLIAHSKI